MMPSSVRPYSLHDDNGLLRKAEVWKRILELVGSFGGSKKEAIIVQPLSRIGSKPRYFILPEVQEQVEKAVFVIVKEEEDHKGVEIGAFYTPTLAAPLALKNEMADLEVVARNPDLDFAILKTSQPRSFIPYRNGRPDNLKGRKKTIADHLTDVEESLDAVSNGYGHALLVHDIKDSLFWYQECGLRV
ncbi:uncharacterized protein PHALS_07633 [Plasmopara halstedii]|uniref:Uncharacterized protein n=1 Tax=Plasmopara halstedii TaxID=4781 RepID=A0A0P1B4Z8_PLAHL|nr:uncharacterized protein PHALS_07633 [Plasmopara halstedii]CEG49896.1 hypothetical protein PHALS_07633 [Plasmopara halstedii]|eukprot:XP_024586265.1 hypothetical protein PHALS_07633 [Plasmopara halstedii]